MTAPKRRPSGRLPARVYWFRRALVVSTALALVFALAHVLTGSSDPKAASAAKETGVKTKTQTPAVRPIGPVAVTPGATATGTPSTVGLAAPDGPCAIDEVTVTPVASTVKAGSAIPLTLQLSGIRPACTFTVSPDSIVAKVTAGTKRIWSSQDCPTSVAKSSVVVRSGTPTTVQVTWSGRYSDAQCSRSSDWALPGAYQVQAAAIGSEPSEAELKLSTPPRPVVTKTVHPKTKKAITKAPGTKKTATKTTKKPGGTTKTPATGRRTD